MARLGFALWLVLIGLAASSGGAARERQAMIRLLARTGPESRTCIGGTPAKGRGNRGHQAALVGCLNPWAQLLVAEDGLAASRLRLLADRARCLGVGSAPEDSGQWGAWGEAAVAAGAREVVVESCAGEDHDGEGQTFVLPYRHHEGYLDRREFGSPWGRQDIWFWAGPLRLRSDPGKCLTAYGGFLWLSACAWNASTLFSGQLFHVEPASVPLSMAEPLRQVAIGVLGGLMAVVFIIGLVKVYLQGGVAVQCLRRCRWACQAAGCGRRPRAEERWLEKHKLMTLRSWMPVHIILLAVQFLQVTFWLTLVYKDDWTTTELVLRSWAIELQVANVLITLPFWIRPSLVTRRTAIAASVLSSACTAAFSIVLKWDRAERDTGILEAADLLIFMGRLMQAWLYPGVWQRIACQVFVFGARYWVLARRWEDTTYTTQAYYQTMEQVTFAFLISATLISHKIDLSMAELNIKLLNSRKSEKLVDGLLSWMCDAVVRLDGSMHVISGGDKLSSMLMRQQLQASKASVNFLNLVSAEDREAFVDYFNLERSKEPNDPSPVRPLHLDLQDSLGNKVRTELFCKSLPDDDEESGAIHIIGIKEDSEPGYVPANVSAPSLTSVPEGQQLSDGNDSNSTSSISQSLHSLLGMGEEEDVAAGAAAGQGGPVALRGTVRLWVNSGHRDLQLLAGGEELCLALGRRGMPPRNLSKWLPRSHRRSFHSWLLSKSSQAVTIELRPQRNAGVAATCRVLDDVAWQGSSPVRGCLPLCIEVSDPAAEEAQSGSVTFDVRSLQIISSNGPWDPALVGVLRPGDCLDGVLDDVDRLRQNLEIKLLFAMEGNVGKLREDLGTFILRTTGEHGDVRAAFTLIGLRYTPSTAGGADCIVVEVLIDCAGPARSVLQ